MEKKIFCYFFLVCLRKAVSAKKSGRRKNDKTSVKIGRTDQPRAPEVMFQYFPSHCVRTESWSSAISDHECYPPPRPRQNWVTELKKESRRKLGKLWQQVVVLLNACQVTSQPSSPRPCSKRINPFNYWLSSSHSELLPAQELSNTDPCVLDRIPLLESQQG